MFLLDTNVVSALRRPERLSQDVIAWAENADVATCYLSVITVLEIEKGILARARSDQAAGTVLRKWFDADVLSAFSDRIIPVDTAVALRCTLLHVPDPQPERDGLIAATALVHTLTVVTRNVADFARTGAPILNPWGAPI